jgi:hypothetical protein
MIYFFSTAQDHSNASYYRGQLFEDLLRRYLSASGYDVEIQRRKTNSLEYDLHGSHKVDGRLVIGEAKAHTETIGGKEVAAFVGKALPFLMQQSPGYSAIFLSASPLSPEAEDYLRNLEATTPFRIASKCGAVLERHIRATLDLPSADAVANVTHRFIPFATSQALLHTDRGTFVAVIGCRHEAAFDDRFALVGATGAVISDQDLLQMVKAALAAFQELEPVVDSSASAVLSSDIPLRDIPVGLITGADWLDYRRPAGNDFFVGRDEPIQRATELVAQASTGSIVEVKSRSGVGKSSLLSVLADRWRNAGHVVELHDARDVQSAEDVLRLIQRFVSPHNSLASFEDVPAAIAWLGSRLNGMPAIFLVDQFESTFLSPEVFTAYEYLALCIARAYWPCSMIFSRKDDLLTTHDEMLVNLERIRGLAVSVSLEDFSRPEASTLIERATAALPGQLSPKVLVQVLEFAQGFPWLLKRTLAHVFSISRSGVSQTEMLSSGLHLADLFEEELAELDEQERGYLTRVAAVLPATYHALARRFEDDPFLRPMLEKLTHRKLLRFSAGTYDTYNDVFKDFLLYERLPEQGQSELVRIGLVSVMKAFRALGGARRFEPADLSQKLEKSLTGTYNVLRDMRLCGLVAKTSSAWEVPDVVRQYEHQGRLGEYVRQSVLKNHIVAALLVELEKAGKISKRELAEWLRGRFPFVSVKDDVWHQYATTLSDWMVRLNLAELDDADAVTPWRGTSDAAKNLGNLTVSGRGARPRKAAFLPSCDWITLKSTYELVQLGSGNGMELRRGEMAARGDLMRLGAIVEETGKRFVAQTSIDDLEQQVRTMLSSEPYVHFWRAVMDGSAYQEAIQSNFEVAQLAPGTQVWLAKKLANWGRSFGQIPRRIRVRHRMREQDLFSE